MREQSQPGRTWQRFIRGKLLLRAFPEVSTWHVLHDEKKSVVGTECKRRFDEIVASNVLESLIFVFDQSHLILSPAFFDFDNFDGVKVVGVFPLCQVDFTKGSFS